MHAGGSGQISTTKLLKNRILIENLNIKTSILRFVPIDEKSFNFGRENCTNRFIFLYFDIFEKLLLKTAIICNCEGGQD